jgi:FlaA1/EpsC-like NDP-sugar epimerase
MMSNAIEKSAYTSLALARRRAMIGILQSGLFVASVIIAFLLRFELTIPTYEIVSVWTAILVCVLVKTVVFTALGLDRGWWRYVSIPDLIRLGVGNLLGSCLVFLIIYPRVSVFPRSFYPLDLLLCFVLTSGIRVIVRIISESTAVNRKNRELKRCLIYGAGDAGIALVSEIRQNPSLPYLVCGFIDDNPEKKGMKVQGVAVLGNGAALAETARKQRADLVLIAMSSASRSQITRVLEQCNAAGVAFKTIPSMADVIQGYGLAQQIRDVAVEDLLERSPVNLDEDQIGAKLRDRVVLVTGAAGSIGSELCRQIARFRPAAIVAYEVAESPLFHLEREIALTVPDVPFHAEIGSVQSERRLAEVFERYSPSVVYHAAAYKHVPLMERHIFEAVDNNVFGTLKVAVASAEHGVEEFVMISSDKAVRPTSVMGATKRLAELVIRSLQNGGIRYTSVRFGNVLGSNGSVVPIFKEQIARGGPVTVTHPEMRRYFMTIPEACQLVLQSSIMAQGGEIFVLDMGEPVRIADLARNLILLSGLRPDEDIKIQFTGVRPGEKLYEEVNLYEEGMLATRHEKIKIFAGAGLPWFAMEQYLARIRRLCDAGRLTELVLMLKEIIPDYNPSGELLRRALKPVVSETVGAADGTMVSREVAL